MQGLPLTTEFNSMITHEQSNDHSYTSENQPMKICKNYHNRHLFRKGRIRSLKMISIASKNSQWPPFNVRCSLFVWHFVEASKGASSRHQVPVIVHKLTSLGQFLWHGFTALRLCVCVGDLYSRIRAITNRTVQSRAALGLYTTLTYFNHFESSTRPAQQPIAIQWWQFLSLSCLPTCMVPMKCWKVSHDRVKIAAVFVIITINHGQKCPRRRWCFILNCFVCRWECVISSVSSHTPMKCNGPEGPDTIYIKMRRRKNKIY